MGGLQKFLSEITSLYWWISVFLVGLILNMFGNLAFKIAENLSSNFSQKVKDNANKRKEKEKKDELKLVNMLVVSHAEMDG